MWEEVRMGALVAAYYFVLAGGATFPAETAYDGVVVQRLSSLAYWWVYESYYVTL